MDNADIATKPAKPWLAAVLSILSWGLGLYYAGLGFGPAVGATLAIGAVEMGLRTLPATFLPWHSAMIVEGTLALLIVVAIVVTAVVLAKRRANSRRPRSKASYAWMILIMVLYGMATGLASDLYRLDPVAIFVVGDGNTEPALLSGDRVYVNMVRYRETPPPTGTLVAYRDPTAHEVMHVRRVSDGNNPSQFFLIGQIEGIVWSRDPNDGVRWDRFMIDVP